MGVGRWLRTSHALGWGWGWGCMRGWDRNDQTSLVPCGGQGDTQALPMATRPCKAGGKA